MCLSLVEEWVEGFKQPEGRTAMCQLRGVPKGTSHQARPLLLHLPCLGAVRRCCQSVTSCQEGAGLADPSNRACTSSCCARASEQREGCRPSELPFGVQVTELGWQRPAPIFRPGICTSALESLCTCHPQVTLLAIALRKPPECFLGSSSFPPAWWGAHTVVVHLLVL